MPEGDTVYLAARRLHTALGGRQIIASDFRLPNLATVDLSGVGFREVRSYGKHLLFRLDNQRTVHTHFRMDGSWHLYRSSESWRGGPGHHVRVVLRTSDVVAVGYRLHDVALVPTERESELIGHLGPDILAEEWPLADVIQRLQTRPHVSIAAALTDQRIVAGIGNIYRCESLFLAGVDPWIPVGQLPESLSRECFDVARTLLMRNREHSSQATTGDRARAHFVYGRAQRPCYRCQTRIMAKRVDETSSREVAFNRGAANQQTVTWCPTCQPAAN